MLQALKYVEIRLVFKANVSGVSLLLTSPLVAIEWPGAASDGRAVLNRNLPRALFDTDLRTNGRGSPFTMLVTAEEPGAMRIAFPTSPRELSFSQLYSWQRQFPCEKWQ